MKNLTTLLILFIVLPFQVHADEQWSVFKGNVFELDQSNGQKWINLNQDCTVRINKNIDIRHGDVKVNGEFPERYYITFDMKSDVSIGLFNNFSYRRRELGVDTSILDSEIRDYEVIRFGKTSDGMELIFKNPGTIEDLAESPKLLYLKAFKKKWHNGYFAGSDRYKWAYKCIIQND